MHVKFILMPNINKFYFSLVLSLSVVLLLILTTSTSLADFSSDYQDYLKLYDSYRKKHSDYLTTRNQYLTYGTLNAKNSALTAVKEFMSVRDDVLLNYFTLVRLKYFAYTIYLPLLDADEKFLAEHKPVISPVASLEDAVKISQILEKQHLLMQINSRKIVGALLFAKLENLKNEVIQAEFTAQNIINTLKSQNKDVSILERWLLDAQSKRAQAELKQQEIESLVANLSASNLNNLSTNYNQIAFLVQETNQYLKEAVNFLNELKEAIKYGDY